METIIFSHIPGQMKIANSSGFRVFQLLMVYMFGILNSRFDFKYLFIIIIIS